MQPRVGRRVQVVRPNAATAPVLRERPVGDSSRPVVRPSNMGTEGVDNKLLE